ncbi:MAG: sulfite exporter TauE/SafE family protein [Elusimicrobia bacterium]|nr:sulfite exporter TauE/SafE family protein [Elusimicrobiota bacterium]
MAETILRTAGLLAAGAASGLVGALLGLGGGIFLIPALVLGFGVPMHSAVAAGLVAVIATSSAGGAQNAEHGVANVRLGMVLEVATVLGALGGGFLAQRLAADWLGLFFAAVLLAVSVTLCMRRRVREAHEYHGSGGLLDGRYHDPASGREVVYSVRRLPVALATSLAAGFVSALLGLGGGILKVPGLHLFCGVPMKAATATSNLMIGVTAAASATIYLAVGAVPGALAATVCLGVLAGSRAGVRLSRRLSERLVARLFAVVTLTISLFMFRRFLHGSP